VNQVDFDMGSPLNAVCHAVQVLDAERMARGFIRSVAGEPGMTETEVGRNSTSGVGGSAFVGGPEGALKTGQGPAVQVIPAKRFFGEVVGIGQSGNMLPTRGHIQIICQELQRTFGIAGNGKIDVWNLHRCVWETGREWADQDSLQVWSMAFD